MKLKLVHSLALGLLIGLPAQAQVQLFEAEMSGIAPHAGGKWSQGIQEWTAGLEYTIDGRISFGFDYSKPISDTIDWDPNLKSYTINPYGIFEFIEPDNLKSFSFAIRTDFIHENTTKSESTTSDPDKLNNFNRTALGAGPIFALRIFAGEKLILIPSAGYEFFYVTHKRDQLRPEDEGGSVFDKDEVIWHDATGACAIHYHFTELLGLSFEP
ncbi:MAG TPA: hypothetical protein VK465_02220, partial [Fibrobacteria bacterium]|nr:hypothetical protein [Fibrobacteria bacterium]